MAVQEVQPIVSYQEISKESQKSNPLRTSQRTNV